MAESKEAKQHGLRFTLPGAPHTYHQIAGMRGYFHPDHPTPVGGHGEPTLEQAKAADKDPGCAVKLVEMSKAQADKAREQIAEHRGRALPAAAAVARGAGGHEADIARDELAAATAKEN